MRRFGLKDAFLVIVAIGLALAAARPYLASLFPPKPIVNVSSNRDDVTLVIDGVRYPLCSASFPIEFFSGTRPGLSDGGSYRDYVFRSEKRRVLYGFPGVKPRETRSLDAILQHLRMIQIRHHFLRL